MLDNVSTAASQIKVTDLPKAVDSTWQRVKTNDDVHTILLDRIGRDLLEVGLLVAVLLDISLHCSKRIRSLNIRRADCRDTESRQHTWLECAEC